MITSIDSEKAFDEIQHPVYLKSMKGLQMEKAYLNMMNSKHDTPLANIMQNGKKNPRGTH